MANEKATLRTRMRALRAQLDPATRQAAARAMCDHLLALPSLRGVSRVAVYSAIGDEADIAPAAEELRSRGIVTAYPRVVGPDQPLCFHAVQDAHDLAPSAFGIPEPSPDAPVVKASSLDVIVLPALALDRRGSRLGWGGGYYDRTTVGLSAHLIGVVFECQVVDALPRTTTDLTVHTLVTERGPRDVSPAGPRSTENP